MKAQVRARLLRNRFIAFLLGIAAVSICIVLITQIVQVREKNAEMEARKIRLEEQIALQEERQAELDDEENYVKTQEYIEEKAKSIGYVYPDEIIFKKAD